MTNFNNQKNIIYNVKSSFIKENGGGDSINYLTLSILIIFILFFLIELYTPFHSDDFFYGQMEYSFDKHFHHYMTWSGRVVSDYASTILLNFHNYHIIISFIIALFSGICQTTS